MVKKLVSVVFWCQWAHRNLRAQEHPVRLQYAVDNGSIAPQRGPTASP